MVCVGPATRLNSYLTMEDKRYRFKVRFGSATDTDDAAGQIIKTGTVPKQVYDLAFAQEFVSGLVGPHRQIPPVYSAIKVKGERSYKAARSGNIIDLEPRDIEIYDAKLRGIDDAGLDKAPEWIIDAQVSKGTYIRSIARDIGNALGVPAHVSDLVRTSSGPLSLDDCLDLDSLSERKERAALDPVRLLGFRLMFVEQKEAESVSHGLTLDAETNKLFSYNSAFSPEALCSCTTSLVENDDCFKPNEMISVVAANKLVGLYQYDQETQRLKPRCVFAVGVSRGIDS